MTPEKVATRSPFFKSNSLMDARFCSVDISRSLDIPAAPAKAIPRRQTATPPRMIRPEWVPRPHKTPKTYAQKRLLTGAS